MDDLIPLRQPRDEVKHFISCLLDASGKAHVMHLNTRSYAEHKALDKFYKEIPELADALAEAYLGMTDEKLETHSVEYLSPDDMLTKLYNHGMAAHSQASPAITNPIEDVLTFILQIKYLLKLK